MTITIDRASASITVTQKPSVNAPTIPVGTLASPTTTCSFSSNAIRATGTVKLNGAAGDNPVGWELGFIQAQWIETNWVYYRGQSNSDGSLLLQRGKPPARPRQGCRDCVDSSPVANVWYNPADNAKAAAGAFPMTLNCSFFDKPGDSCKLVEVNGLTGKNNFLREAQFEFHFCTVLAVKDPAGKFHQLKSFYWNEHWQARFLPTNFAAVGTSAWTITLIANGNSSNTSHIIDGAVIDARFKDRITGPETQSCNAVFRAATAAVEVAGAKSRRESRVWDNFDVRR